MAGKNYLQDSSDMMLTWNIAADEKTWTTMPSAAKQQLNSLQIAQIE